VASIAAWNRPAGTVMIVVGTGFLAGRLDQRLQLRVCRGAVAGHRQLSPLQSALHGLGGRHAT
jgi:hypothetical protein